jgi:hypothetical protein
MISLILFFRKPGVTKVVVGGGPTIYIHHYELKAAYANINHFHPLLRVPLFDFDGPRRDPVLCMGEVFFCFFLEGGGVEGEKGNVWHRGGYLLQ